MDQISDLDLRLSLLVDKIRDLTKEEAESSLLKDYEIVALHCLFQRTIYWIGNLREKKDTEEFFKRSKYATDSSSALSYLQQEFQQSLERVNNAAKLDRSYAQLMLECAVYKNSFLIYETFAHAEDNVTKPGCFDFFDKITKQNILLRDAILVKKNEPIPGTNSEDGLLLPVAGIVSTDWILQANDPLPGPEVFDVLLRVDFVTKKTELAENSLKDEVFGIKSGLPNWKLLLASVKDYDYGEQHIEFLRAVLDGIVFRSNNATTNRGTMLGIHNVFFTKESSTPPPEASSSAAIVKQPLQFSKYDEIKNAFERNDFPSWIHLCASAYVEVKQMVLDCFFLVGKSASLQSPVHAVFRSGSDHLKRLKSAESEEEEMETVDVFYISRGMQTLKVAVDKNKSIVNLIRLAYTSKLKHDEKVGVALLVESIVTKAVVYNAKNRITGALILAIRQDKDDGKESVHALQVLEGGEKEVMRLYRSIEKDPRHVECKLVVQPHAVTTRRLGDWSMQPVDASRWDYLMETAKLD